MQLRTVAVPRVLDVGAVAAMATALADACADEHTEVVLLEGGAPFCTGLDLEGLLVGGAALHAQAAATAFAELLLALRFASKPTVAVLRGDALGGGLGLAAACDVVVAARDARVGLPEATVGLAPSMILPLIGERIGSRRARHWALTPQTRNAAEAAAAGLVDEVVDVASSDDHAALERAVRRWAKALRYARPEARALLDQTAASLALAAAVREGAALTGSVIGSAEGRARIADALGMEVRSLAAADVAGTLDSAPEPGKSSAPR